MDLSCIQLLIMKPIYHENCLYGAVFFSKFTMNLLLIGTVYFLSSRYVSVYEGHAVGILVIYFICASEFILNVLVVLGKILELDTINDNSSGDIDINWGGFGE